eukprot:8709201-Pyramimonas_sp.AAC.1
MSALNGRSSWSSNAWTKPRLPTPSSGHRPQSWRPSFPRPRLARHRSMPPAWARGTASPTPS